MKVLLVTTWDQSCGIAEHAAYMGQAITAADPSIQILPSVEALDPAWVFAHSARESWDLIHLNYQAALHSRWTPDLIARWRATGTPVLITYHDSGVPATVQQRGIYEVSNAMVVHEPMADLPGVIYLRQGVPAPQAPATIARKWWGQPVLGSVGFPFPWKNYPLLAEATAEAGWALLLLAPGATPAEVEGWQGINPACSAITEFLPASSVVSYLSGCDATAFLYAGCNAGTSGAIRQGIAARKLVIASEEQRQFRDLRLDAVGEYAIEWIPTHREALAAALVMTCLPRVQPKIVRLAARDSWARIGAVYARLYGEVVAAGPGATVTGQAPEGVSAHLADLSKVEAVR